MAFTCKPRRTLQDRGSLYRTQPDFDHDGALDLQLSGVAWRYWWSPWRPTSTRDVLHISNFQPRLIIFSLHGYEEWGCWERQLLQEFLLEVEPNRPLLEQEAKSALASVGQSRRVLYRELARFDQILSSDADSNDSIIHHAWQYLACQGQNTEQRRGSRADIVCWFRIRRGQVRW